MLVAFAVALPLGVKAMEWFFDIEPFNRVANALTKIGFAVLFLSCLASAVALPFSVMRRAETPGGVWTLLIIYVVVALLFRWLSAGFGLNQKTMWYVAGALIVLYFLFAIGISISLLLSSLFAIIPPVALLIVFLVVLTYAKK